MQSAERRDRDRFLARVRADQKARSEKGPSAVQQDPSIGRRGETTRKSTCVFGTRAHARIPSLTRSYTGEITGKVKLKPLDVDAERRASRYQDKLHADLLRKGIIAKLFLLIRCTNTSRVKAKPMELGNQL